MKDFFSRFIVFCGVGGINTIVSLTIILGLSELAGVHYVPANVAGYAAGVVLGFFLHKHITFRAGQRKGVSRQFLFFLLVFLCAYIIQLCGLIVFVRLFGIYPALAQILSWVIFIVINYTGNKLITFSSHKHGDLHSS